MSVRGRGASYPSRFMARTVFFASWRRKSRWIVILSHGRRNPSSLASFAEVATFAIPIVSNAFRRKGSGSADTPSGIPSRWRMTISFVPPPAGRSPTPTSTSPMYVSAAAPTRAAPPRPSAAPPPDNPLLGERPPLVHHRDDVAVDRVHLGVELEAQDAVADVDQRGPLVPFHHPVPVFLRRQADDVGGEGGGSVPSLAEVVVFENAVAPPVERGVPAVEHLPHGNRDLFPLLPHPGHRFPHAAGVPRR